MTTSIAILEKFKKAELQPDYVAGHSLGEYTALVAAGAFSFEDGVYAVHKKGRIYGEAVPDGEGTMAAVLAWIVIEFAEVTEEMTEAESCSVS